MTNLEAYLLLDLDIELEIKDEIKNIKDKWEELSND